MAKTLIDKDVKENIILPHALSISVFAIRLTPFVGVDMSLVYAIRVHVSRHVSA